MNQTYQSTTLNVVEFKVERDYQSSINSSPSHEGFTGELWGNECFEDNTPTDIDDRSIDWHIF